MGLFSNRIRGATDPKNWITYWVHRVENRCPEALTGIEHAPTNISVKSAWAERARPNRLTY